MEQIKSYFTDAEYKCKCGRPECDAVPVRNDVRHKLNILRHRYGKPIKISSGSRCAYWNEKTGGSKNSAHVRGYAVDIPYASMQELFNILKIAIGPKGLEVESFGASDALFTRIGVHPSFLHVDMDPKLPKGVFLYFKG